MDDRHATLFGDLITAVPEARPDGARGRYLIHLNGPTPAR